MLSITVTLLHGTIRAGSPDDTTHAGTDPVGEWPPSPARLFSALVAADGTGSRCTKTSGEELCWLEGLDPPSIHASALEPVVQPPLLPRFVVVDETSDGAVQEYPARKATEVRPGVRLSPRECCITYHWANATPSDQHLTALRYRAARVGYLGCSDSPVRVTVHEGEPATPADSWVPDGSAAFTLPVPYPGFLDALDRAFAAWLDGGAMNRSWIPTRRARYRAPATVESTLCSPNVVIWLRFARSVSGRSLLRVTSTLRAAVIDHVQRLLGDDEVPTVLHGHRPDNEHGPQADFIGLPDVGHVHATGRLFGAAISLPEATDPALVERVRAALFLLAREGLVLQDRQRVELSVFGGELHPWAANPRRWAGPARRWTSVTPVVHERWTRRGPDRAEVRRWCEHVGLQANDDDLVSSVEVARRPWVPGGIDLPPALVFRVGRERWPYSHMRLTFARRVEGPLVLGRGRQLGFGLFAPDESSSDG
jgi:CRISPR-associated protein Csb2